MIARWRKSFLKTLTLTIVAAVCIVGGFVIGGNIAVQASKEQLVQITVSDFSGGSRILDQQLGYVCYRSLQGGIWCDYRSDIMVQR